MPGGRKPSFLADHGHEVINPALDDDDFDAAVRTAQAEYNQHRPDVIVGSSRGGAVAMNFDSKDTPLVLLCPAWKNWGSATTIKPQTIILHSRNDDVIPFVDSEEVLANSGIPSDALIEVGDDHRLADASALPALNWACDFIASTDSLPWVENVSSDSKHSDWTDHVATVGERLQAEVIPWVEASTVPLFHIQKNVLTNTHSIIDKNGMGILLKVGGDHFLLTASHIVRDAAKVDAHLCMSWDDEEGCPIPLSYTRVASTDPETMDVAVIGLTAEVSEKLLRRHTPISLLDFSSDTRRSFGPFLIVGYPRAGTEFQNQNPMSKVKPIICETLKYLGTRRINHWGRSEFKYSPLFHVIVQMQSIAISSTTGDVERLPDHAGIEGISGCGIWAVAEGRVRKPLSEVGIEDCRLIAIEHRYDDKASKVMGTWIDVVLHILEKYFPNTRSALKLEFPR